MKTRLALTLATWCAAPGLAFAQAEHAPASAPSAAISPDPDAAATQAEAEAAQAEAEAAQADADAVEAALWKAAAGQVIMQLAEKALGPAKPPEEPPTPPPGLKDSAPADLHAELDRIEGDLLTLGIFPNSSGFMDAKLYFRKTYLDHFSSGIYFDYLTFQLQTEVEGENGPTARSDTLDRQYRFEADAVKGILPLHRWVFDQRDGAGTLFTVEPGLNAKFIIDQIESSGYRRNGLGESVFLNEEKDVLQFGASAKVEVSLAAGTWFALDGSFEYLPYIYSQESAQKLNSQFPGRAHRRRDRQRDLGPPDHGRSHRARPARRQVHAARAPLSATAGRVNTASTVSSPATSRPT
jgi:hypothetical protein